MDSAVVALTDQDFLRVSSLQNAIREVEITKFQQHDPLIFTKASSLGQLPLDTSSVEFAIFFYSSVEFPSPQFLEDVAKAIKPDGVILVVPSGSLSGSPPGTTEEAISSVKHRLLISGFKDVQVTHTKSVKARKVSWVLGSSFAIKGPLNKLPEIQVDNEMDLIDEDTLLTPEDLVKPEIIADCGVGSSRKACKNCTCGRGSEEEEKTLTLTVSDDMLNNPQSNCGSCGLGDAFRCGTCPFKGLPPFKPGEKVLLPSNFLTADI